MLLNDFMAKAVTGIRPGDERHRTLITASKVSACYVPSRSPYDSFDSLYRQLTGEYVKDIPAELSERGHMLEPALADWFQFRHPEYEVVDPHVKSPLTWFGGEFFAATPDRLLIEGRSVVALLEVKTANRSDEWGESGGSSIPEHYYDQVQWQMFCTGVNYVHVVALVAMQYREYTVWRNDEHIQILRDAAQKMLDFLSKPKPPLLDPAHASTYEAVRACHPLMGEEVIELDFLTAVEFLQAGEALSKAKSRFDAAKATVGELMGTACGAEFMGFPVAIRQARGEGKPFVAKARKAPHSEELMS